MTSQPGKQTMQYKYWTISQEVKQSSCRIWSGNRKQSGNEIWSVNKM